MAINDKFGKRKTWHKDIHLTSLGWELALPIFGGALLGSQIDRLTGSNYFFTLVLLFLGVLAGYYRLFKFIQLEMLRAKLAKLRAQKEEITS